MQISSSILVILVIACFLGIKAIPLVTNNPIDQQIINLPPGWPYPFKRCSLMGATCTTADDCCQPYGCGYAGYYNGDTSSRCCGGEAETGCTVVPGTSGQGCCSGYYCGYTDATETETMCHVYFTK